LSSSSKYGHAVEADVVVVGGGAIGVTAAYELARRGARVTLVERGETVAAGCSAGNGGLICPSHSLPLATPAALRQGARSLLRGDAPLVLRPRPSTLPWLVRFALACRAERAERGLRALRALSLASLELHAQLSELGTSFERRGILSVYETEAGLAAARHECETPGAETLSAADAVRLEPSLSPDLAGAFFHPAEAHVDPFRYVQALGVAAAAEGADLRTRVEVRALRRRNGAVTLETGHGELRPQTVVLSAGAWTPSLVRGLGVDVPVTGGKGYHVDLPATADDPRIPILMPEARSAATPLEGRLRLTGTLDICGLDLRVDGRRVAAVRAAARVLRDGRDRQPLSVWAGLRPCTPDGLPLIGRCEGLPGLVLATGHAMKGISLAPVTGRLVAELVAGEQPSHDLSPFGPGRFRPFLPRRLRAARR
jgi:D-amino-acid dehydrogenase